MTKRPRLGRIEVRLRRGPSRGAMATLALLSGARVAGIALQAVTLGLQARAFGVTGFGIHATAASIGLVTMTACDFGLGSRALRLGAEESHGIARNIARLRVTSLIALALAMLGAALALPTRPHAIAIILASGVYVAGESCGELASSVWLGERRRAVASASLVLRRMGGLAPFAVFGMSVRGAVAGLLLGGVVGLCSCLLVALRRSGASVSIAHLIRSGLPYWGSSLVGGVQRLDVLIVSAVSGPVLAGLYGASSRLSNPVNTGTSILFQFGVPEVSLASTMELKRHRFTRLRRVVVIYAVLLVAVACLSQPITTLLLGSDYERAWVITAGVIVGAAVSALAQTQAAWFLATGMPGWVARDTLLASIAGLGLLGLLAWSLGIAGAALGTVLVSVATLVAVTPGKADHVHRAFSRRSHPTQSHLTAGADRSSGQGRRP